MTLTDFVFRGDRLSDLDCMVAYMVTSPSESVSMGSVMTHETLYINSSYKSKKIRAKYEEPITATWDIFKKDCNQINKSFSDKEISHIMKWLGSKTSAKFCPIYDDSSYPGIYFMGTFNKIDAITIGSDIVGFTVTFEAETPWGYGYPRTIKVSGNTENWEFMINCDSDDEGYLYPDSTIVKIGNLGSKNEFAMYHKLVNGATISFNHSTSMVEIPENKGTVDGFDIDLIYVRNCVSNEILTFNSEYGIIESNQKHATLYNDFNYNYPRLFSKYKTIKNVFTVSIPCEIEITYSPIRKVGIFV